LTKIPPADEDGSTVVDVEAVVNVLSFVFAVVRVNAEDSFVGAVVAAAEVHFLRRLCSAASRMAGSSSGTITGCPANKHRARFKLVYADSVAYGCFDIWLLWLDDTDDM
jgi:hypothetical protein